MNHRLKIDCISLNVPTDVIRVLFFLLLCAAATLSAQTSTPALNKQEKETQVGNSTTVNTTRATAGNRTSPMVTFGSRLSQSVKVFGAVGNGTTDDSTALNSALAWMASTGGCLYFPAGAYTITSELDWVDTGKPLCLRGESYSSSYLIYLGTKSVDAAIHVGNTADNVFSAVDISNLGVAANQNARYAFHAIRVGPPANLDNVAFMGGSVSTFEGDLWNGQSDIRNLLISSQFFNPSGSSPCINGLTFSSGPISSSVDPSSQFTLTMPTIEFCTGIGLNLADTFNITINGGQIAQNTQQLYQDCSTAGCNRIGNNFNNVLLEAGTVPSQIYGSRNTFVGLLSNSLSLNIYGDSNSFEQSVGIYGVQRSATNTRFINDLVYSSSTDAGRGTYGSGNTSSLGGPSSIPWNSLPLLNTANSFAQTQHFQSEAGGVNLAVFGQISTRNAKAMLFQNNPTANTISLIALQEGVGLNQTLALNPGGGPVTVNSKEICLADGANCPAGFTGTKTAGSCTLTIVNGIITSVTGC